MGSANMRRLHRLAPLVSVLALSPLISQAASTACTGFSNPPASVRPKFRYWLPDAGVSLDTLRDDIANMSAVGVGGFEFIPFYLYGLVGSAYGPDSWAEDGYGTPKYKSIFTAAAQAAKDNGLVMDFAIGPNQGQGAPAAPETHGLAVELLLGNTTVAPGDSFSGPVPPPGQAVQAYLDGLGFQHPLEQWGAANLTGVIAAKVLQVTPPTGTGGVEGFLTHVELDLESAIDLTLQVAANGSLQFAPPEPHSTWRIFSFWEKYTNQKSCVGVAQADTIVANGSWTVDHFSAAGAKITTDFLEQHVLDDTDTAELIRAVGSYAWEDSMEHLATLYWTPGLLDDFEKARGYSLLKYLPVLFRPDNNWGAASPSYAEIFVSANSTAVNLDYRRTLSEGYHEYLTHIDEWARQVGVRGYSAQPAYNLAMDMLSSVPLLTAPELESLTFANKIDAYRQFTGAAHLAGRNIISSEAGAVAVAAYSQRLPEMLGIMTRSYAGGVNQVVVHGFPYSGPYLNTTWPGYTTFFYKFTDMWNQIQPAWQHLKDVFDFMGRTQWVLQQGTAKVDLALYLQKIPWTATTSYSSDNLRRAGYTYEYLGPDNLGASQATVQNGVLAAKGPAYKALIFEGQSTISVSGAENILRLARAGLPIIFVGAPPEKADSAAPGAQRNVSVLMQKVLASSNTYLVSSVDSIPDVLSGLNLAPRVALGGCDAGDIFPVWRHDASVRTDYVYLFNQGEAVADCPLTFSVLEDAMPFVYDAWTGNQSALFAYHRSAAGVTVEVSLATNQTMILAFKPASAGGGVHDPLTVHVTNGTLKPIFKRATSGNPVVGLFGPTTIESASGKKWSFVNVTVPAPTHLTSWNITIDSWHSVSNRSAVQNAVTTTSFANHPLVAWRHLGDGYESVSGVGTYSAVFQVPTGTTHTHLGKLGARLRLGPVDNTVRAWVDGRALPPVDITNPVVDLGDVLLGSNAAAPGSTHVLQVQVSSTLFNRVKADLDTVMVFGAPASYLQPEYAASDPKDYGLLGPVVVEWYVEQELRDGAFS